MTFLALSKFVEDFQAWIVGELARGYNKVEKDKLRDGIYCVILCIQKSNWGSADLHIFRTQFDKQPPVA